MMNYHSHDDASSDGAGSLLLHAERAVAEGLVHLCTTNHVEVLGENGEWTVSVREARPRFLGVRAAAEEVRGRLPDLELRVGAEFEYRPGWREPLERLSRQVPFDLVIGSVHEVDGLNVSGGSDPDRYFGGRSMEVAYRHYFETVLEMVEWGAFDVLAHLDLVTRYGHDHYGAWEPARHEESVRSVLEAAARRGIGIEVNASGVREAPGRPYPHGTILRWAREAGLPFLTVGADSHRPEDVTRGLREALVVALDAGWSELTLFRRREPTGTLAIEDAMAALGGCG